MRANCLSRPAASSSKQTTVTCGRSSALPVHRAKKSSPLTFAKGPIGANPAQLTFNHLSSRRIISMSAVSGQFEKATASGPDTRVVWTVELTTHLPEPPFAPQDIGLELTAISLQGDEKIFSLSSKEAPTKVERVREDLPGRVDTFQIKLPPGFEVAAVKILDKEDKGNKLFQKGGKYERIYLKALTLKGGSGNVVNILCNSYIYASQKERLFVRDDAFSNPALKGNKTIEFLQDCELKEIRGEGKREEEIVSKPRTVGDRIYRYSIYNDLGGNIVKKPQNIRIPLGGGPDMPYPRRLDTNRGLYPGTPYEKATGTADSKLVGPQALVTIVNGLPGPLAPIGRLLLKLTGGLTADGIVAAPWLPEDDNFDTDKTQGFLGNAVVAILPAVATTIDASFGRALPLTSRLLRLLGLSQGKEFDNVGEVLSLFDKKDLYKLKDKKTGKMPEGLPDGGAGDFGAQIAAGKASLANASDGKVSSRSGKEKEDGSLDIAKFPVPKCLDGRLATWTTDEEYGRQFLAGLNPIVLEVLDSAKLEKLLEDSASIKAAQETIDGELEGKTMAEWAAAGEIGEPRLFIVDYWAVHLLLDTIEEHIKGRTGVMHAGRCIFFRRSDKRMVPVAIELTHSTKVPSTVYTNNDPAPVWQLAKSIFGSTDSLWHQLISHWLRTHACTEPYLIATRRHLPVAHPVFKLMMPHFRYTLPINAAARGTLICAGGFVESTSSPWSYSMQVSAKVYGLTWQFKDEGLVADLKKRGFLDASGKLRVSDYPYAEDGLLVWDAITKYFTSYINMYYPTDADVVNDKYITNWYKDIRTEGHADANPEGWIELTGKDSLVTILSTMAWVASAHHAAVNFGQYDYSAWMPNHASVTRRPAPARDSAAWQALASKDLSSAEYFSYISPPDTTAKLLAIFKLLSAHAADEQYLSDDHQEWLPLYEPEVKALFESFVTDIKGVEQQIDAHNKDPKRISRSNATNGIPYTLLYPSSKPGVTGQGIPYSISI